MLDDIFDIVNVFNYILVVSDIYELVIDNNVDLVVSLVGGFLYVGLIGVVYEGIDYFVFSLIGVFIIEYVKNFVMDGLFIDKEFDSGELVEFFVSIVGEVIYLFVMCNFN